MNKLILLIVGLSLLLFGGCNNTAIQLYNNETNVTSTYNEVR